MRKTTCLTAAAAVTLFLLCSCISQSHGWMSQRSFISPAIIYFSPVSEMALPGSTSQVHRYHRTRSRSRSSAVVTQESVRNYRRDKRRALWISLGLGLAVICLLPMRTVAVAITEPIACAAAEATTAATSALPQAVEAMAPSFITAGPPIPADIEMKLTFRLIYAALMGSALGKERSFAKHSAGVRTMALVAMGAAAFTICSAYGFLAFGKYDPSRMASNVASGVGFVGAGVITTTTGEKSQNVVHGLTTAATIWLSAAVGVACGVGLFRIATTAAFATITILRLGRVKPTYRNADKTQGLGAFTAAEDHVEVDEATHDTTEWDEISPRNVVPKVKHTSLKSSKSEGSAQNIAPEASIPLSPPAPKKVIVRSDPAIKEMLAATWRKNATADQLLHPPLRRTFQNISEGYRP